MYDDFYDGPPVHSYMPGFASTLPPPADEFDAVAELRKVVEEITGIKAEQPQKPRIGFLP